MKADYRKIVQSLSYLASKCGKSGLNRLHAFKMIFLADRDHLRRCGSSITCDSYCAMKYGPLPVTTEKLIKAKRVSAVAREYADAHIRQESIGRNRTMLYCKKFDRSQLSEEDIASLDAAWSAYTSHPDIVEYTHAFTEWKIAAEKLTDGVSSVPMRLEDFFLPAPPDKEYCAADHDWVKASKELYLESSWVNFVS